MQQTPARWGGPGWSAFPPGCNSHRRCERPHPEPRCSLWNGAHQGSASAQPWALASHNAPGSVVRAPGGDRAAAAAAEPGGGFAGRGPGGRGAGRPGGGAGAGPEAAASTVGGSCAPPAGSRRGLGRTLLSLGDLSTWRCSKVGGLLRTILFWGVGGCRVFSCSNWRRLQLPKFRHGAIRLAQRGLF